MMIIFIVISFGIVKISSFFTKRDKIKFSDAMAPTWRKMNYLESTTKNFDFAKDIRLFNMSNAFFNQLSGVNETYKELNRKHHNRMVLWEVSLGSVLIVQKILMYTWLVYNVVTGAYQISDFVLYVGLVSTFHASVGYVNWIYSDMRTNSLMINDYRNFVDWKEDRETADEKDGHITEINLDKFEFRFENVSFKYPGHDNYVLKNVNLTIKNGAKLAVVGVNGAGKTTLFKIITGEYEADNGEVIFQKGSTYGYLSQVIDVSSHRSIYEEMLDAKKEIIEMEKKIRQLEKDISTLSGEALESAMESYSRLTDRFEKANGYAWKSEITGVLKGLGFDESQFATPIHTLSGGQKTRVALSRILLMHPDLILLDEPTNHLDMESIRWLETFLSNYRGAVLIVSHDRYFLDKVVDKVIEIERGTSQVFNGNYSAYAEKKKAQRDAQMKLYMNQQQEIHHQEEVITKLRSFNREKSIKRAESREKMLSKLELVDKPVVLNSKMRITLEPEVLSGNDVLTIEGLSKSFGDKALFRNLNVQIKRGEVVGLLGANGTGKTTLLKIINRQLRADSGKIRYGSKVSIGYYDQEQHVLDDSKTIFDEISDAYPKLTNTRIRNVLAAFLFTGEDVFQVIGTLSGGEKGRVSLAKLMLSNANFIILDEPTNHLDIQSREILEEAINNYEGTVFYVSHDRYFINQTATRILDLSPEGIVNYKGNYNYYLEQKEAGNISADSDNITLTSATDAAPAPSPEKAKEDWKRSREEAARQRKRANDLKKTEKEISRLEEENDQLKEEMALPENATNVAKLMELNTKFEENEAALLELYDKWEELSE